MTTTVTINQETITVPQSWNEIPLQQQFTCYKILTMEGAAIFAPQEVLPHRRLLLLMELMNWDGKFLANWEQDCILADPLNGAEAYIDELSDLLSLTDFFFTPVLHEDDTDDTPPTRFTINLGLTKCPYPELIFKQKGKRKMRWFAPADGLSNISIVEMAALFTTYEHGMTSENMDWVESLLAIMYRPSKATTKENKRLGYEGDRRIEMEKVEHRIKVRTKKFKDAPVIAKQLLLFWFASCRQAIINNYPRVFISSKGDSQQESTDWAAILLSLAGGVVHVETVAKQNHHNALKYLDLLEKEREERKLKRV